MSSQAPSTEDAARQCARIAIEVIQPKKTRAKGTRTKKEKTDESSAEQQNDTASITEEAQSKDDHSVKAKDEQPSMKQSKPQRVVRDDGVVVYQSFCKSALHEAIKYTLNNLFRKSAQYTPPTTLETSLLYLKSYLFWQHAITYMPVDTPHHDKCKTKIQDYINRLGELTEDEKDKLFESFQQ